MKKELKKRQSAPTESPEQGDQELEGQEPKGQEPEVQEEDIQDDNQEEPQEDSDQEIDYEEELKRVREENAKLAEERDNYKQGLLNEKSKKGEFDEEETDVSKLVQKELASIKTKDLLTKVSENQAERELILEHYNSSINKTGYSDEAILGDLLKAKALANAKKLERDNKFLKDSMLSNATQSNSSIGNGKVNRESKTELKLNDKDKNIIENLNRRRQKRGQKPLTQEQIAEKIKNYQV